MAGTTGADARLTAQRVAAKPSFKAVSIVPKRPSGSARAIIDFPAKGGFTAIDATLIDLIRAAYAPDFDGEGRILGGPEWATFDRFDMKAATQGAPGRPRRQLMLQTLLAEHFMLKTRTEQRVREGTALVMARRDRKLGPDLRVSTANCPPEGAAPPRPTPRMKILAPCGVLQAQGRLTGYGATIAQLVLALSNQLRRRIRNETGLAGRYDFELRYAHTMPPAAAHADPARFAVNGISLYTALEDRLGLRIAPGGGPINVLVIDQADHPAVQ